MNFKVGDIVDIILPNWPLHEKQATVKRVTHNDQWAIEVKIKHVAGTFWFSKDELQLNKNHIVSSILRDL